MALLNDWRALAYNEELGTERLQQFWGAYFQQEKAIYQVLLQNPDEVVKGTVKELAEKFETDTFLMTGFLDGINEYKKRLSRFSDFNIIEIEEENFKNPTPSEIEIIKEKEAQKILPNIKGKTIVMVSHLKEDIDLLDAKVIKL